MILAVCIFSQSATGEVSCAYFRKLAISRGGECKFSQTGPNTGAVPRRNGRWLGVVAQRQERFAWVRLLCGEGCVVSGGANLFGRARRECTGRVWRTLKLRCIIGGRGGKARARDIIQYPPEQHQPPLFPVSYSCTVRVTRAYPES